MVTNRAARLHVPGEPVRIEDVDLAEPAQGEVLVDLSYAGVNPVDTYAAAGRVGDVSRLPRTLGVEASGHLDGQPIVVHGVGLGLTRDGVWGRRAVVPRAAVVDVPAGVELRAAAGLGVAGSTAWRVVHDLGRVGAEDRVLVLAAAGGVGCLIVQLAKAAGATVWGHTGSEGKRGFIRSIGADEVVVADAAGLAGPLAELHPTIVFDSLGGAFLPVVLEAVESLGRIVTYGTSAGPEVTLNAQIFYRKSLTVRGYGGIGKPPEQVAEALRSALGEVAAGRLRLPVSEVLPLEAAEEALARVRARATTGKLLLALDG